MIQGLRENYVWALTLAPHTLSIGALAGGTKLEDEGPAAPTPIESIAHQKRLSTYAEAPVRGDRRPTKAVEGISRPSPAVSPPFPLMDRRIWARRATACTSGGKAGSVGVEGGALRFASRQRFSPSCCQTLRSDSYSGSPETDFISQRPRWCVSVHSVLLRASRAGSYVGGPHQRRRISPRGW